MACDANQVLVDGVGFNGLTTPHLKAVQLQLLAASLLALDPAADVSFSAIMARAHASGFDSMSRSQLRGVILQLLCDTKELL